MAALHSILFENGTKTWLDVTDPSPELLHELAERHELHPVFVKDCLDPNHLPTYEQVGDTTFIITRAFDEKASDADTVQGLTRKVAIFASPKIVLTIHRADQPFLQKLREEWEKAGKERTQAHLLNSLLAKIIASYNPLIERTSEKVDALEAGVFHQTKNKGMLAHTFTLKRTLSIAERLIRMTEECLPYSEENDRDSAFARSLQDRIRRTLFSFDDLELRIDNMVQLHLAVESQKNNEVVRILTLFSAFFLPLTFIAGIYGMNFAHMPELAWPHGYFFALVLMAVVSVGIWFWFRKKGWLGE